MCRSRALYFKVFGLRFDFLKTECPYVLAKTYRAVCAFWCIFSCCLTIRPNMTEHENCEMKGILFWQFLIDDYKSILKKNHCCALCVSRFLVHFQPLLSHFAIIMEQLWNA